MCGAATATTETTSGWFYSRAFPSRLGLAQPHSGSSRASYKYVSPTFATSLSDSVTDETDQCEIRLEG